MAGQIFGAFGFTQGISHLHYISVASTTLHTINSSKKCERKHAGNSSHTFVDIKESDRPFIPRVNHSKDQLAHSNFNDAFWEGLHNYSCN